MSITPKLKFLLMAPLFVVPFLCVVFHTLGGGQGSGATPAARAMGLNTQLPGPSLNARQMVMNKIGAYHAADADSMRKREAMERDRYLILAKTDSIRVAGLRRVAPVIRDPRADQLMKQLGMLHQTMRQQPPAPMRIDMPPLPIQRVLARTADTVVADPQIEKLNSMLDKVIRIQHPSEVKPVMGAVANENTDEVLPADSASNVASNVIKATIPTDQVLVTGRTISLRLAQDVVIHGVVVPRGQLIYGVVSINNDRMLVHIRSFWDGRNLYTTELQVYDLDGLPGIHIPGMLSQDVAKQSADESVNGINLSTYDPSIGAQAANAGIQAAKTFLGRKVRLVRVSVRAGYAVLLRNTKMSIARPAHSTAATKDSSSIGRFNTIQPPGFVPGGSFIRRCRTAGVELGVQGIYLQDSLLWIALRWTNHSPIPYTPDYCRWSIRDKRVFKRTAQQELLVEPVYQPALAGIAGDSNISQWTAFRPFALAKGKELVLEVGERGGGRTLELAFGHQLILHAKILLHEKAFK